MAENAGAFKKGEKRPNQGKRGPNKTTKQLKDMILCALDDAGGQAYLAQQARDEPKAFMALLGRVLPTTISGDKDNPLAVVAKIELVPMSNDDSQG